MEAAPLLLSQGLDFLICKEEVAFRGSVCPYIPGGDVTTGELFLGPGGGRSRPEPLGRGEVGEASRAGSDLRETQVYPFISNIISDLSSAGDSGSRRRDFRGLLATRESLPAFQFVGAGGWLPPEAPYHPLEGTGGYLAGLGEAGMGAAGSLPLPVQWPVCPRLFTQCAAPSRVMRGWWPTLPQV